MKNIDFFLLTLIVLGAFIVRLYHFNSPVADWHSWRQSDTSSVSRNFIKYGFDIFHPKFDDLSNGVSLIDNPQGYRFVEFPIYNVLQAGLFKLFSHFTIEEWGRLVTIFSSLGSIVFIYLLVTKYISSKAGLISAFFFAFLPYSIYYGRVILPDQLMVMTMLGGIYLFDKYLENTKSYYYFLLALLFSATAVLIKPFVLFFSLLLLYLAWKKFNLGFIKQKKLWVFALLTLLPFVLWRLWMNQYPEGIPRNDWLFNGNNIRFTGSFFHWIFAERISRLILGFFGLPFVILGLISNHKKEKWLFYLFAISAIIYLTDLATGNIQHDYYQILIIPSLAILFGKGVDFALSNVGLVFNTYVTYFIVAVSIMFMLSFGWFEIRYYYGIQHPEIIEAGKAVDQLTPRDAKIIAIYNGDTTFLYQTNRRGWPVFERSLKDFVKAGAGYIAFVNPSKEELHFSKEFTTVKITSTYAIFDLTKPLPAGKLLLK